MISRAAFRSVDGDPAFFNPKIEKITYTDLESEKEEPVRIKPTNC